VRNKKAARTGILQKKQNAAQWTEMLALEPKPSGIKDARQSPSIPNTESSKMRTGENQSLTRPPRFHASIIVHNNE